MDLEDIRQRLTARVMAHDDEDVAVRVEVGGDEKLHVTVISRDPLTYYTQWVELGPDGKVERPTPDDGFTLDMKRTPVGTAATADEAVDLVVREVEGAVAWLREKQAWSATSAGTAEQDPVPAEELAVACQMWQGGRDSGSSRLRGAARALTGVRHYFWAPFIREHEAAARAERAELDAGAALLRAVNAAPHLDADGWNARVDLPARGFAGRGIAAKPGQDAQIERQLRTRLIEMPLWGVSLDRAIAEGFGTRFLFELVGPFPAVPAWVASGAKAEEQELIAGGRYRVLSREQHGETTHVRLRWIGASGDRVGSDDLLLNTLGAVPGVTHSALTRYRDSEVLEVQLDRYANRASVTRVAGSASVEVVRYWEPEPDPSTARYHDDWMDYAAMRAASRRTTVPADVESIVSAVLKGKETG